MRCHMETFFHVNDLFLDLEDQTFQSYTMAFGDSNRIHTCGLYTSVTYTLVHQDPKYSKEPLLYAPGTQVLIKVWKDGSPKAQLQPTLEGPYPVILSTSSAFKVQGHNSWIHYSQVKLWKTEEDTQYICEPWEISDIYSSLQMSAILMNTPKIKFLGIRFLRLTLKNQISLTQVVLQNRQERSHDPWTWRNLSYL